MNIKDSKLVMNECVGQNVGHKLMSRTVSNEWMSRTVS